MIPLSGARKLVRTFPVRPKPEKMGDGMNEVGEEKPGKEDEEREPPADSAADVPAVPDDEMEEITMDDEEEAVHCSPCKEPGQPTKREIEEHAVTHLPFRMCCPFCVQGKSKDDPHRKV